jgi:hypothetical protein
MLLTAPATTATIVQSAAATFKHHFAVANLHGRLLLCAECSNWLMAMPPMVPSVQPDGRSATGDFSDAKLIRKFGDVPDDLSAQ